MLIPSPKVSIIMPTFNRAAYIGETIESVRRQTYSNWELIIVDDGSTDDTQARIEAISDERIHFFREGRIAINGKVKNIGLRKCKGELIAFIDSDDLWAETKLEKQVRALEEHPGCVFSLTGGYNFRKLHQPIDFFYKQKRGICYGSILVPFFKSQISTTTPSLIFRRSCLEAVGGFEETQPFSDVDFILKLASHFQAVILYEPLLFRRLHPGNDSGTNWIEGYEQGLALTQRYRPKLPRRVARQALFRLYINFGEDYVLRRHWKDAAAKFFLAWKKRPFSIIPLKKTLRMFLKQAIDDGDAGDGIKAKPWKNDKPLQRVLVIRLQAMGDMVIVLPYLQYLRKTLPASTKIDFLTKTEYADIPKNIVLFDDVVTIAGGVNTRKQLLSTGLRLPKLLLRHYDAVIDLQANEVSALVRKVIRPAAWAIFDRFSARPAGERTQLTIESLGLGKNGIDTRFRFKREANVRTLLTDNGWDRRSSIVVLNPAGAFPSRNWPLENFASFAHLWLQQVPHTQFLMLGTSSLTPASLYMAEHLGDRFVNLIGKTSPSQAFAILQQARLVLTEDSGLMHMSWVCGAPTFALLGSTRSDWSQPLGVNSSYVDSSDLPCGNCMQENCLFGDNHCMTRYSPELIFEKAVRLLGAAANIAS